MSTFDVRSWSRAATLLVFACGLSACGGSLVPVFNIQNAPIIGPRGRAAPTRDQVHDAVMRALSGRGWQVNSEDANGVTATVVHNQHSATMHVQYDERFYSIHYVDSSPSLGYNGDEIHRRYNDWVDRLSRSIRWYLMAPSWGRGFQVVVTTAPEQPPPPPDAPPPGTTTAAPPDALPPPNQPPPPTAAPYK